MRFVDVQMIRLVVSLADVAQSRAVLLQEAVDGIQPEPATVVIFLRATGQILVLNC